MAGHTTRFQARCIPINPESTHGSISKTKVDNRCNMSGGSSVIVNLALIANDSFKRSFEIQTTVYGGKMAGGIRWRGGFVHICLAFAAGTVSFSAPAVAHPRAGAYSEFKRLFEKSGKLWGADDPRSRLHAPEHHEGRCRALRRTRLRGCQRTGDRVQSRRQPGGDQLSLQGQGRTLPGSAQDGLRRLYAARWLRSGEIEGPAARGGVAKLCAATASAASRPR